MKAPLMALRPFPKAAALIVAVVLALARVASAHQGDGGNSVSLLRDTEIEADIRTMMTPIWQVAGLDPDAVHVYLVDDDSINSFVAGGQNIFINSGLVLRAKSPNQLIGVLAHETGHIAGGHLYKGAEAMHDASIEEIIAIAAGVAATVASRGSDGGAALLGAAGVGERAFLQFSVTQEATADHAAMNYLDATHQSARGLLQFFELMQTEELLTGEHEDPYLTDHPLDRGAHRLCPRPCRPLALLERCRPALLCRHAATHQDQARRVHRAAILDAGQIPGPGPLGSGALCPRHRLLSHSGPRQGAARRSTG